MRTLISILIAGLAACSGESEYAALYENPTVQATEMIYGTWGGTELGFEVRVVLASDRVTFANKCGSKIVGVDVAAQVSETQIKILEAAQDGNSSCSVTAMPNDSMPCSSDPFTPKDNCFVHDGYDLTLYDDDVTYIALSKLSDAVP